jgi:hypothetical protein
VYNYLYIRNIHKRLGQEVIASMIADYVAGMTG